MSRCQSREVAMASDLDPVKCLQRWLELDHEGRLLTIAEDGSFPDYVVPVLRELESLRQLRAEIEALAEHYEDIAGDLPEKPTSLDIVHNPLAFRTRDTARKLRAALAAGKGGDDDE
jgi:hypothetical protein